MKKPYKRPRLKKYGRIESLTTGFTGAFADGMSGGSSVMMMGGMGMGMGMGMP